MLTYVTLGFFDALSVTLLMFSLYRFPILEYKWKLIVMAAIISFTSYIIREPLSLPDLDPLIQITLFTMFLRLSINTKLKYAALIPTSAFAGYILIQMIIFLVLNATGVTHISDASTNDSTGIYITQICTILVVYLLSFLMKYFSLGFSFIPSPPHSIGGRDRHSFAAIWPAIILSVIGVAFSIKAALSLNVLIVIPIEALMFALLFYLSYLKGKKERDRIYRTTNFRKNK